MLPHAAGTSSASAASIVAALSGWTPFPSAVAGTAYESHPPSAAWQRCATEEGGGIALMAMTDVDMEGGTGRTVVAVSSDSNGEDGGADDAESSANVSMDPRLSYL